MHWSFEKSPLHLHSRGYMAAPIAGKQEALAFAECFLHNRNGWGSTEVLRNNTNAAACRILLTSLIIGVRNCNIKRESYLVGIRETGKKVPQQYYHCTSSSPCASFFGVKQSHLYCKHSWAHAHKQVSSNQRGRIRSFKSTKCSNITLL